MDYIPVSKVLNHFIVVDDDKTFITARELHIGIHPSEILDIIEDDQPDVY